MFTQDTRAAQQDGGKILAPIHKDSATPVSPSMMDQLQELDKFHRDEAKKINDAKIEEKFQWKKEHEYQAVFNEIDSLKKNWLQRKKDFSARKKQFLTIIRQASPYYSSKTFIKEINKLTPKADNTIPSWTPKNLIDRENQLNTLINHLKETQSTLVKDLREEIAAQKQDVEVKEQLNDINEKTKKANLFIVEIIQQAAKKYKEHCIKEWNPKKYPEFLDKFGSVVYVMYNGELDLEKGFGFTFQSNFLKKKLNKEKVPKEIQVEDILKYPLSSLVGIFNKIFETCKLYGSSSSAADILDEQITKSLPTGSDEYLVYERTERRLKLSKHALSLCAQVKDADLKASEKAKEFDESLIYSTNKKLEAIKNIAKGAEGTLTLTDRDTSAMKNAKEAHDLLVKNATEQYSEITKTAAELQGQLDTTKQAFNKIDIEFKGLDTGYKKYLENVVCLEVKLDSVNDLRKLCGTKTGETIDASKHAQHMLHGQAEEKISPARILIEAQSKRLLEAKKLFHAKVHLDHKRVFDTTQETYLTQLASEQRAIDQVKQIKAFDYELTHYGNLAFDCSEIKSKNQKIDSVYADVRKTCEFVRFNHYNLLEKLRMGNFKTVLDCCTSIEKDLKSGEDLYDAAAKEYKDAQNLFDAVNKKLTEEKITIFQDQEKIDSQGGLSQEQKNKEKSTLKNCYARYEQMVDKVKSILDTTLKAEQDAQAKLTQIRLLKPKIQTYKKIAKQSLDVEKFEKQLKSSEEKINDYEKQFQKIADNIPTDAKTYEEESNAEEAARNVLNDLSKVVPQFLEEEENVNSIHIKLSNSQGTESFVDSKLQESKAAIEGSVVQSQAAFVSKRQGLLDKTKGILIKIDLVKALESKDNKESKQSTGSLVQACRVPQMILDDFEVRRIENLKKISLVKRVIEINAASLHQKVSGIGRGKKVNVNGKDVRISTGLANIYNIDNHAPAVAVQFIVAEGKKRVHLSDSTSSEKKYRYTFFGVRDDVVVDPFYKVLAELDNLSFEQLQTRLHAIANTGGLAFPMDDVKRPDNSFEP